MVHFFSNKISGIKVIMVLFVAVAAIFYNVKLFTVNEDAKNTIALEDIYIKWDARPTQLSEVTHLIMEMKHPNKMSPINALQSEPSEPETDDANIPNSFQVQKPVYFENKKDFSGTIESIQNITVKKEELLQVKFVDLAENENSGKNESVRIEFWKSPINFTGYKKHNHKIILYGIEDIEKVNFKFAKNKICLEYGGRFFEIEETKNFKKLLPISDESIIATLIQDEP